MIFWFFLKLRYSPLKFISEKFPNIWHIEWYGIRVMNFETAWICRRCRFYLHITLEHFDFSKFQLPDIFLHKRC